MTYYWFSKFINLSVVASAWVSYSCKWLVVHVSLTAVIGCMYVTWLWRVVCQSASGTGVEDEVKRVQAECRYLTTEIQRLREDNSKLRVCYLLLPVYSIVVHRSQCFLQYLKFIAFYREFNSEYGLWVCYRLYCNVCYKHYMMMLSHPSRFSYPRGMEGWVDLGNWLHTEMAYPHTDSQQSNRAYTRGDRCRNRSERSSPRQSPRVYTTGDHHHDDCSDTDSCVNDRPVYTPYKY